jgi:hypothetical protein
MMSKVFATLVSVLTCGKAWVIMKEESRRVLFSDVHADPATELSYLSDPKSTALLSTVKARAGKLLDITLNQETWAKYLDRTLDYLTGSITVIKADGTTAEWDARVRFDTDALSEAKTRAVEGAYSGAGISAGRWDQFEARPPGGEWASYKVGTIMTDAEIETTKKRMASAAKEEDGLVVYSNRDMMLYQANGPL